MNGLEDKCIPIRQRTFYRRYYIIYLTLRRHEGPGQEKVKYMNRTAVDTTSILLRCNEYVFQSTLTKFPCQGGGKNLRPCIYPRVTKNFFSNLTSVSGHKATSRHRVRVSFALLTKHWFHTIDIVENIHAGIYSILDAQVIFFVYTSWIPLAQQGL